MNPQKYTFDGSPKLPPTTKLPPSGKLEEGNNPAALIDIAETSTGVFELVSRPIESGQPIVRKSTGQRGYLLRAVTNQIYNVPHFGKVTVTTEEVIAAPQEDGDMKLYNQWDTSDWQIES